MTPTLRLVAVLLVATGAAAKADPSSRRHHHRSRPAEEAPEPPPPAPEEPWARGVPQAQRDLAGRLLEVGNGLFLDSKPREALATYREALAAWDHPAIRFNIVRTLILLDRPVEAYENLEHALSYGKAPLEEQVYLEAQGYRRLLAGQIAEVEVTCAQRGAAITLDGQAFLSCPGERSTRLLPGNHQLVAKKPDHLTVTRELVVLPGKKAALDMRLISLDEATVTRRRWAAWKPWAVVGGGALIAGTGFLLDRHAAATMARYEREIAESCTAGGCAPNELPGSTLKLESRAILENRLAIGTMIGGGALVVAGLTLVILNAPHQVLPEGRLQVAPAISTAGAGVTLRGEF